MTLEREEKIETNTNTVVDHFHSLVVEVIAFLSRENKNGTFTIENSLSEESKLVLQNWKNTFDFIQLLNFLIPCPYFHDLELFVNKLIEMSDEEFLYHLLGEELQQEQIHQLLKSPSNYVMSYESFVWDTDLKKDSIINFIHNLGVGRLAIYKLLMEISHSSQFVKVLHQQSGVIEESMQQVKAMTMEPLTLAQYIMGKNFRRVSNYRIYYFIPSYFFTGKMRIFNSNLCMVFYNCTSELSDDLQQSKVLDAKLKALADPNRLILLRMLSGQKQYGARLAEFLGVTTATVSHHLDILKKSDLIKEDKIGTIKYFTSNKDKLEELIEQLKKFLM